MAVAIVFRLLIIVAGHIHAIEIRGADQVHVGVGRRHCLEHRTLRLRLHADNVGQDHKLLQSSDIRIQPDRHVGR